MSLFMSAGPAFAEDPDGTFPTHDPDPNAKLRALADFLAGMEDDLTFMMGDDWSCGVVQAGLPTIVQDQPPDFQTQSFLMLLDQGTVVADGQADTVVHQSAGSINFTMLLENAGSKRWTLAQGMWLEGGALRMWGTLAVFDLWSGSVTYTGGWIYSQAGGIQEDPASEPGFHDQAADMFGCVPIAMKVGSTSPAGFGIGNIATLIGNIIANVINSLLDIFTPPTTTTCLGPLIKDGVAQSCASTYIPCRANLTEMCDSIDDLPHVSAAFKRCMKGRCGCGGSNHRRLRISCAQPSSCGPCSYVPGGAYGCNIGGSQMWYCDPTADPCDCVGTTFHEMSHSCGALDLQNDAPLDSYRIGGWFKDACTPVGGQGRRRIVEGKPGAEK